MNTENRILTLDPELVADVRSQVEEWNEELLNPWKPSHAAQGIAQTIRNSCPRMAEALEATGIFEPWAEMLHDEILELARDLRERGVIETANEAEHEARQHLIPWCWEMQEEWLEAHCLDYEPEPDPDLYGPDDPRHSQYEEPEEENEVPFLNFDSGHLSLIQRALVKSIKALLGRNGIESGEVMCLGAMLSLVERLPRHYDEYSAQLQLSSDMGTGVGMKTVTINADGLMLDVSEIIRGEWGSDSSSKTILLVNEHSSSSSDPFFDLEDWLSDFSNDAADADVAFSIDWFPEDEMPTFEGTPRQREPRYLASSVAWAIATLGFPDGADISPESWSIRELVDDGKFGEWLKGKIEASSVYESPSYQPDSVQSSEAASASAEEERQATMTLETLTKIQQQALQAQVDVELPYEISLTISQLMPFGGCDDEEEEAPIETP